MGSVFHLHLITSNKITANCCSATGKAVREPAVFKVVTCGAFVFILHGFGLYIFWGVEVQLHSFTLASCSCELTIVWERRGHYFMTRKLPYWMLEEVNFCHNHRRNMSIQEVFLCVDLQQSVQLRLSHPLQTTFLWPLFYRYFLCMWIANYVRSPFFI